MDDDDDDDDADDDADNDDDGPQIHSWSTQRHPNHQPLWSLIVQTCKSMFQISGICICVFVYL